MANEYEVKKQICELGRRMYERGFVAANDGNISFRLGGGRFLCTPTGVSKGHMKPEMISVVDDKGKQLSGSLPRTSEILLHLEIYHELPEMNAVCHAHPPHATAFAIAGISPPACILPEVEVLLGTVPIAEYDTPGSKQFAQTILPHLRKKANTILLANHGAVACDKTLEQAYFHLETLDTYCRILLLSKQVGNVRQLPADKMQDLMEIKKKYGIDDPRIENGDFCHLPGGDEFLRGFSTCAIPQHAPDASGHGRGEGIAGLPSQAGQAQPLPASRQAGAGQLFPATVAGRFLPGALGASSETARRRAADDEIEKLVQLVTDQIVQQSA
jgi:L-fuculose-phosphate aldolase